MSDGPFHVIRTDLSEQEVWDTFTRRVIPNDDSGKWDVHQFGCCLASFENESMATEFAAVPVLAGALRAVLEWGGVMIPAAIDMRARAALDALHVDEECDQDAETEGER